MQLDAMRVVLDEQLDGYLQPDGFVGLLQGGIQLGTSLCNRLALFPH